jgi:crotonobetainyl-CoA:carnitine CoA-transferase CaiB-like acyl-CoA transferase
VHFDISMQDTSIWMTQIAWPGALPAAAHTVVPAADGSVVALATAAQVERVLGAAAGPRDRAAVVTALAAAGVACAPVLTVGEVAGSAQVAARGLLLSRPTSDGDAWTVIGSPLRLRATPGTVRRAMARLGAEDAIIIGEFALRESPPGAATPHPQREAP